MKPLQGITTVLFILAVISPNPLPAQGQSLLLKNAKIYTMGEMGVLEKAMMLVEGGKIKKIGQDIASPQSVQVFDLSGKTVIPGIICASSSLFLHERDLAYAGEEEPDTNILEGVHYFDASIREVLKHGVTTVYISPVSFRSTGALGAVVKLSAADKGKLNILREKAGLSFRLDRVEDKRSSNILRLAQYHRIRDVFKQAQEYRKEWQDYEKKLGEYEEKNRDYEKKLKDDAAKKAASKPADLKKPKKPEKPKTDEAKEILLQAMDKKIPVRFKVHRPDAILQALRLAEEFGLLAILEEGEEWGSVLAEIERASGSLLFNPLQNYRKFVIPGGEKGYAASSLKIRGSDLFYSDVESASKTGYRRGDWKKLAASKVPCALIPPDQFTLSARFMRLYASFLVSQGISQDAALSAITSKAAQILGVSERVGSLGEGKDADFVVLEGDPLDSMAVIQMVFVDGLTAWKREK